MSKVKDSGSMRTWDSGAHRDNAKGKGRCDLLPLTEVAMVMEDPVIAAIAEFTETFNPDCLVKALKFAKDTIFEGQFANMFLEVSHLYEDGAEKYGEDNWRNGMPISCYIDSGTRHYLKTLRGDDDEPHYRGFVWNMLGALWSIKNIPDSLENYKVQKSAYKVK